MMTRMLPEAERFMSMSYEDAERAVRGLARWGRSVPIEKGSLVGRVGWLALTSGHT